MPFAESTAPKSCHECPSFVKVDEVPGVYGKSIGAPVCRTYGHILGRPGLKPVAATKLLTAFAGNCPGYGQPPIGGVSREHSVVVPDFTVIAKGPTYPSAGSIGVSSCLQCENYVPDNVVMNDFGWAGGLCAAKGQLLLTNRLAYAARDCDWASLGTPRHSTMNLYLKPLYEEVFGEPTDLVAAYFKDHADFVDPREYKSDRVVTEDERRKGIRAWRCVTDKSGESSQQTFLPIFMPEFFTENERSLIPTTGDDEHPEDYVDHNGAIFDVTVLWQELDETPAIWGPPGTGKTEFFRHMAWLMQLPFARISISAETEVDDLIGTKEYSAEQGTYFRYGRLPKRWTAPGVLVFDEANTAQAEVWQAIRPLTDNSKQLVVDQADGVPIKRDDYCYFGFAMNPEWDARNVGTNMIGDADGRRLMHLYFNLPPRQLEREILKQRCAHDGWDIPEDTLNTCLNISEDIRRLVEAGTLPVTWGVANNIKVVRAMRYFGLLKSYRRGVTDLLEPSVGQEILDIVRGYVKE